MFIFIYSTNKIIEKVFDVETMNAADTFLWYDTVENRCNVMASFLMDKHDGKATQNAYRNILPKKFRRFRSKMVKILDNYYFKELEN